VSRGIEVRPHRAAEGMGDLRPGRGSRKGGA
jgi:hypothetical protein